MKTDSSSKLLKPLFQRMPVFVLIFLVVAAGLACCLIYFKQKKMPVRPLQTTSQVQVKKEHEKKTEAPAQPSREIKPEKEQKQVVLSMSWEEDPNSETEAQSEMQLEKEFCDEALTTLPVGKIRVNNPGEIWFRTGFTDMNSNLAETEKRDIKEIAGELAEKYRKHTGYTGLIKAAFWISGRPARIFYFPPENR